MDPRRVLAEDLRAPNRWPALDGIRGVAVLSVVVYHVYRLVWSGEGLSRDALDVPAIWWPLGTARFAIDAFFVLSGFLVVRSWRSVRRRRTTRSGAVRDFAARRALRVLPAYWVSLVVLVPLVAPSVLKDARQLLLFVTVNQYVDPGLPAKVNTVYWSLTTEWHFYLLVPLVAWLLLRVGRWPVLLGALALSVAWWWHTPFDLAPSFIFGRLDQFVAGAVAAELVSAHDRGEAHRLVDALQRRGLGVGAVVALLALGSYHGSSLGMARGHWFDPLLRPLVGLVVAAGVVRLLTSGRPTLLDGSGPRLFGILSYSLYLWHYPILLYGLGWAGLRGGSQAPVLFGVVVVTLLLAAIAVLSVASYLLVERPFLTRKASSKESAAPAAPDPSPPLVPTS